MAFGKKKEKESQENTEEVLPTKSEIKEDKGNFSLSMEDMGLVVGVMAERPELKVYNDFIVGQRMAEMIRTYQNALANKEELPHGTEEDPKAE